jgi:hypothetical protein
MQLHEIWIKALATELPKCAAVQTGDDWRIIHQRGLVVLPNSPKNNRLRFLIINLTALYSTGVLCPIKPPPPITVDERRAVVRIARELHRRLILPGLPSGCGHPVTLSSCHLSPTASPAG